MHNNSGNSLKFAIAISYVVPYAHHYVHNIPVSFSVPVYGVEEGDSVGSYIVFAHGDVAN